MRNTARFLLMPVIAGMLALVTAPSLAQDGGIPTVDEARQARHQAMARDLGMTPNEAEYRLERERHVVSEYPQLRDTIGSNDYAGAWFDESTGELVVAVSSAAAAKQLADQGIETKQVAYSLAELNRLVESLDRLALQHGAPDSVWMWFADQKANRVVMVVDPELTGTEAVAHAMLQSAGADAMKVEVRPAETERPRLFYTADGGDGYRNTTQNWRCSIGFAVEGGYATAGHCGNTGDAVSGMNGVSQGTFAGSVFPGDDHAWVSTYSNWDIEPKAGGNIVAGSSEAPVGASVCRYGSTTGGPHCGNILAKNVTVNYASGATVSGLTRTSACAEGGDSGGPFINGNQAQGVLSGGSGNCSSGGQTYFYPINDTLNHFNLTLLEGLQVHPERLCYGMYGLNWNSISGAQNYKVYSSSSSSFTNPMLVETTTSTWTSVNLGTNSSNVRYYRVKWCDGSGCSSYSNQLRLRGYNYCF